LGVELVTDAGFGFLPDAETWQRLVVWDLGADTRVVGLDDAKVWARFEERVDVRDLELP
jgi:hypothetical protein